MYSVSPPRLAACDAHDTVAHVSIFDFPTRRQKEIPWGSERPHRPSLLPTAVICFLPTLKASWREEEKGKILKQIPGWGLMFLNIKHCPAVWKPRGCCTHRGLWLMRNKGDPACIPARHSSRRRRAAQEVQRLDPDADVCGSLSGGEWGCI